MSALTVFGQPTDHRLDADEVGRSIGDALHAGLAVAQGDSRDLDTQRERLKRGAQAIMQAWRDIDRMQIDEERMLRERLEVVFRQTAIRLERRNARKRPALA